jgi:hypothetical protein
MKLVETGLRIHDKRRAIVNDPSDAVRSLAKKITDSDSVGSSAYVCTEPENQYSNAKFHCAFHVLAGAH